MFCAQIFVFVKAKKFNLALSQDKKPHQKENLSKDKPSAVLTTNHTKISKEVMIPNFLILLTLCENQKWPTTRNYPVPFPPASLLGNGWVLNAGRWKGGCIKSGGEQGVRRTGGGREWVAGEQGAGSGRQEQHNEGWESEGNGAQKKERERERKKKTKYVPLIVIG